MNTPAIKEFRRKLAADEPVYGMWVTLDSASISEIGVALGLDWITIDAEHGHLDFKEIVDHLRTTVRSNTVVLVRVTELNAALIKRVLDIGADGIVVPWIESVDALQRAVACAHYPPAGVRGIGAERATAWGCCIAEHVAEADENVLVIPMIESVRAGACIDELCDVPGVEVLFLGPCDYSSSAGHAGSWEGSGVAEQLLRIKDAIRRHGKHCGTVAASNDDLIARREQGFRMLALGLDAGLFMRSLTDALACVGRNTTISITLDPSPRKSP